MESFAGLLARRPVEGTGSGPSTPRLRPIALPAEHGGWSFTLEPVILALIVTPSAAGAMVGLAMISFFLARQPLRLAARDWIRRRATPRRPVATVFAAFYVSAGVAAILAAGSASASTGFLLPLLWASPLFLAQVIVDVRQPRETIVSEFLTPIALCSAAAAVALGGGAATSMAVSLWLLSTARFLPTVLYVRARLRRERGGGGRGDLALTAHAAVVVASVPMVTAGLAPAAATAAFALLLGRAARGLAASPGTTPARSVGIGEVAWGIVTVALIGFGYRVGL